MTAPFVIDPEVLCVHGCGHVAVGERVAGMVGEDELVELVCYEHLTADGSDG